MKTDNSMKIILVVIAVGIWAIVLQNTGLIPSEQKVYVSGGYVTTDMDGTIEVSGSVSVDNTVDVNIHEINGLNEVTTGHGTHSVFPYGYMLPTSD